MKKARANCVILCILASQARGEDDELLTVIPKPNTLALVFREEEVRLLP